VVNLWVIKIPFIKEDFWSMAIKVENFTTFLSRQFFKNINFFLPHSPAAIKTLNIETHKNSKRTI
jgi:hypothetical protein